MTDTSSPTSLSKTITFSESTNGFNGSSNGSPRKLGQPLSRAPTYSLVWWKFKMRDDDDDDDVDWWFASTAIPLIAATLAPLANVLSIGALVTYWRMDTIIDGTQVPELEGVPFRDPRWCYWLNVASLILGFLGNLFLLFNFTNRVRYLIALPMTIFLWYIATGILIAITACMSIYVPPDFSAGQTYTQGFWYAVIAAAVYFVCSMILMVNMLGYFLGHYPQHFTLTDHQRTLILQTMLFFVWLAGGGAVFSTVETRYGGPGNHWSFTDGLYFCDVTILTVGFGDLYPHDNLGRGLVFPYTVGGIIMLGLVISSINKFAGEIGQDKVVKHHIDRIRSKTFERTLTSELDIDQPQLRQITSRKGPIKFFTPTEATLQRIKTRKELEREVRRSSSVRRESLRRSSVIPVVHKRLTMRERVKRKPKLLLLREEKDRFEAMRQIQHSTDSFKRWWRLTLSITAFGILLGVGAVVFWQCEQETQGMTYFEALYFCYVSLLTIGYGDMAPKSNAGRPFFVIWSLIAVPTMTILISDMGDTVISAFKQGTFTIADFTVLPKQGIWRNLLEKSPRLMRLLQRMEEDKRIRRGMPGPEADDDLQRHADIEELAGQAERDETGPGPSSAQLARDLAAAIKRTAHELTLDTPKKYTYEEWVELTRLIRFTARGKKQTQEDEEDEGLIEWDWIGENSPMMSGLTEAEFVLDRLVESLGRYMRRVERKADRVGNVGPPEETNVDEAEMGPTEELREQDEPPETFHEPRWSWKGANDAEDASKEMG